MNRVEAAETIERAFNKKHPEGHTYAQSLVTALEALGLLKFENGTPSTPDPNFQRPFSDVIWNRAIDAAVKEIETAPVFQEADGGGLVGEKLAVLDVCRKRTLALKRK